MLKEYAVLVTGVILSSVLVKLVIDPAMRELPTGISYRWLFTVLSPYVFAYGFLSLFFPLAALAPLVSLRWSAAYPVALFVVAALSLWWLFVASTSGTQDVWPTFGLSALLAPMPISLFIAWRLSVTKRFGP